MAFSDHMTEFAGLPVVEYRSADAFAGIPYTGSDVSRVARIRKTRSLGSPSPELNAALADPGSVAWRLADPDGWEVTEDDEDIAGDYYRRFAEEVDPGRVGAIVVGDATAAFGTGGDVYIQEALLEIAPRLTGLHSLFYADITFEETEVSWIEHGDLAPFLSALPQLTEFGIRGTGELSLHVPRHDSLRRLTLQGGGLPRDLAREVASSGYPELEHLELWLGVAGYGGTTTPRDLEPVLSGAVFPKLRSLGLRNTKNIDDWVPVLAQAPITARLHTLDLSLGTLSDKAAHVLLEAPVFRGLKRLDLEHSFLSKAMAERVHAAFTEAGVEVDLSNRQTQADWHHQGLARDTASYYTAVSE